LFASFVHEARRRGLDQFDRLRQKGPHSEVAPRTVVEYVLAALQQGNLTAAFAFTALPPEHGGKGMANAPLTQRMDWSSTRVINGNPSGRIVSQPEFEEVVRDCYRCMLNSKGFTFVGAANKWGKANVPVHEDQEYWVEVGSALIRIELVYQWLFNSHVIAAIHVMRTPADGYGGMPDGMILPP
jgi:hypothetical protein